MERLLELTLNNNLGHLSSTLTTLPILEYIFENNSLVYIKETNKVASTPKESATSDNYKISNLKILNYNINVVNAMMIYVYIVLLIIHV